MAKNKPYVVAVKRYDGQDQEVKPGKELGSFRKPEHANHARLSLARKHGLANEESTVGIFTNGRLYEPS